MDVMLLLLVLLLTSVGCTSSVNAAPSIALQCASLARFYASHEGPSWANGSGWQSFTEGDALCCSWFGIRCDPTNASVVEIRLPKNGVVGTFPPEWATELPSLAILDFSGNHMTGTLPDAFVALRNLTHLLLERNHLNGTLPEGWSAMKSLFRLEISYNSLTGTIPNSWANISTFKWFYIGHNFITGSLPQLRVCGLLLCGNTGISQNLDEMNWSSYSRSDCAQGTSMFLVGLNLSGSVPCVPFIHLLDISYTDVAGSVPCCPGMQALILDGTSVGDWYPETTPLCVSQTLTRLSASYSKLSAIPMNLASRFPNLRDFAVRANGISQELPTIPSTIEVLDLSENAIVAPTSTPSSSALNLSWRFRYLDLATTSVNGITLLETPLQCGGTTLNATCATVVSVFRAYGADMVRDMNPRAGEPMTIQPMLEEDVVTPPVFMVSGKRLVFHVVLDFIDVSFSGQYRVTISVASLDPNLHEFSKLSPAQVKSPAPEWNNSFHTIGATPAGFAMFDGLNSATLWFGVDYQVDVTFLYKPVLRRGPPPREVSSLKIEVPFGTIRADPCEPATLYGVPLTPVCAACPVSAICNGTSILLADGPVWRQSTGVLPFYECENGGCTTGGPRVGTECADGTTGPLCSNCVLGHGFDSTGNCIPCSSTAWNWSVFVIGGAVLLCAATFAATNSVPVVSVSSAATATTVRFEANVTASQRSNDEGGDESTQQDDKLRALRNAQAALAVKRLQSHFSIFAIIGRTVYARDRSSASVVLQTLQQAASQISLRSISFVNCIFPDLTAITQFQVVLCLIPILLVLELLFVRWRRGRWAVVAVCTATTLLLYDSAINIALQLIPADEMQFFDATQYTVNRTGAVPLSVVSTLSLDRRIHVDSNVRRWQSGAYAWLVLFGIGFPLTVCACYVKLTARYGGQYATENLGFLTNKYRQKRWYWEEAVMVRKFGLAVAVTALRNYPLAQMQAIIAVLMLYVVGLEWQVPFSSSWMHQAERTSCYSALLVANVLMAKGSLQASVVDQVQSVQQSAYTIFGAAVQVISVCMVVVFLYVEWLRARDQMLRGGSSANHLHDDEYEMAEGSDTSSTDNVHTPRRLNLARLASAHALPVNELLVYVHPFPSSSAKEADEFKPTAKICEL